MAQGLTANQQAQGRSNIGALKKNYILNGAMMVSQENGSTAGTAGAYYAVDQFTSFITGTTGAYSVQQVASLTPSGSPNRVRLTVTTADAAVAPGDIVYFETRLEGLRVADLAFGTTTPKMVTLQFGVRAPAGTYSIVLFNNLQNRSYVAEYTISAADVITGDVVKSVVIPGDNTGTWAKDTNGGIHIRFGLMAGITYQQAAGSWGTGNVIGSPNQFNFMGTVNNVFELFDVGLYEGNVAPPFQVPDYAAELTLCQRYYQQISASSLPVVGFADSVVAPLIYTAVLRGSPTITFPYTDASFTTSGSPGAAQWNLQCPNVAVATKTGTFTITVLSVLPTAGSLQMFGMTLSRSTSIIGAGVSMAPIKLNARL